MQPLDILKSTNKRVMIASLLLIILAVSAYVLEYIRGTRSLAYVFLISASLLAPIFFSYIFYCIPKYIEHFKAIALYSFILSWMIMLTFSPKVIQFILIFPLIIIYVLYYDFKLIRNASVIIILFSFFKVFLNIRYYNMNDSFMSTEYTVFILSLVAFAFATLNTITFSTRVRNQQLESILEEKEKNAVLLAEMTSVLNTIQHTTNNVYSIYGELITTSDLASDAIEKLSHGVASISSSISQQCGNSIAMQNTLIETSEKSLKVVEKINHSARQVHENQKTFNELDNYADLVITNNNMVYSKMKELEESTHEIKAIVDMIQKIAVQTNMLALNASIESARAGEAGRGFAVVADAIQELSLRTSQSLEGILDIISRLEASSTEALSTASESLSFSETIQTLIHTTKTLFDDFDHTMSQVSSEITETVKNTEETVHNNQIVVDRISHITESIKESAAHAGDVTKKTASNKALTLKAKALMDELVIRVGGIR